MCLYCLQGVQSREVTENKPGQYSVDRTLIDLRPGPVKALLWGVYTRGGAEALRSSACALVTLNSLPMASPGAHVNGAFWSWVVRWPGP